MVASTSLRFGIDDPARARAVAPARRRLEVLRPLRPPVRLRRRLRRPPRRLPLPRLRPRAAPLDVAARAIELARPRRGLVRPRHGGRDPPACGSRLPGLYNVYNALAAASLALALGRHARGDRRRARAVPRRLRPVRAFRCGRPSRADAADQEPRRRERGRQDARGRRRPPTLVVALNDADRGRARRLVDLGRRLRAAPGAGRDDRRLRRAGGRARAPLHLRWLPARAASSSSPTSRRHSTAVSSSCPPGGELVVLPTYTAMLALRAIATDAASRGRTGSGVA